MSSVSFTNITTLNENAQPIIDHMFTFASISSEFVIYITILYFLILTQRGVEIIHNIKCILIHWHAERKCPQSDTERS